MVLTMKVADLMLRPVVAGAMRARGRRLLLLRVELQAVARARGRRSWYCRPCRIAAPGCVVVQRRRCRWRGRGRRSAGGGTQLAGVVVHGHIPGGGHGVSAAVRVATTETRPPGATVP